MLLTDPKETQKKIFFKHVGITKQLMVAIDFIVFVSHPMEVSGYQQLFSD